LACLLERHAEVAETGVVRRLRADATGRTVATVPEIGTPWPRVRERPSHDREPFAFQRERVGLPGLAQRRRPLDHLAVEVNEAPFRCGELPLARAVEQGEAERVDRILGQMLRNLLGVPLPDVASPLAVLHEARDVEEPGQLPAAP